MNLKCDGHVHIQVLAISTTDLKSVSTDTLNDSEMIDEQAARAITMVTTYPQ